MQIIDQAGAGGSIEGAKRLIQQEQLRLEHQRPGQAGALRFTARKPGGGPVL